MKNKFALIVIAVIAVLTFLSMTAFMPLFAVELPQELVDLISLGITFLVVQLLKWLSGVLGFDVSGWASFIVAATVSVIVSIINNLLGFVPLEFENFVGLIFQLLIALFGAMGVHGFYRLVRPKK